MVEDWISMCGFLEDRTSRKGNVLTLFQDRTGVRDKIGQRGSIFFEDSSFEIQHNNSPKRT